MTEFQSNSKLAKHIEVRLTILNSPTITSINPVRSSACRAVYIATAIEPGDKSREYQSVLAPFVQQVQPQLSPAIKAGNTSAPGPCLLAALAAIEPGDKSREY